jgi:hypothetical protein
MAASTGRCPRAHPASANRAGACASIDDSGASLEEDASMVKRRSTDGPRRSARDARAFVTCVIALCGLAVASTLGAQTVVQNDFEDGTTQGWGPRGGAVLTNTTEAAATGTHSLRTSGRTATWNGPALDILPILAPGTSRASRPHNSS